MTSAWCAKAERSDLADSETPRRLLMQPMYYIGLDVHKQKIERSRRGCLINECLTTSAALLGGRLFPALSRLSSCNQRARFILLCLLRFPGPNHLRVARLVHDASMKASLYFRQLSSTRFIESHRRSLTWPRKNLLPSPTPRETWPPIVGGREASSRLPLPSAQ